MSMLQVRWTLNGPTPTKRKTLAADYNPIHKRLRDFGQEAHELHAMANGVTIAKPQEKKSAAVTAVKAGSPSAAAPTAATTLDTMPATSLSSIVAELEGAGLLDNLETPASPNKNDDNRKAESHSAKNNQLSLGAAGLLSAAGLLPEDSTSAAAREPSNTSDADPSGSDAGSSFEGSATGVETCDSPGERIDPFTFLQNAIDPATPQKKDAPSTNFAAAAISEASRNSSYNSLVTQAHAPASSEAAEDKSDDESTAAERGLVTPDPIEKQPSKPGSAYGDQTPPLIKSPATSFDSATTEAPPAITTSAPPPPAITTGSPVVKKSTRLHNKAAAAAAAAASPVEPLPTPPQSAPLERHLASEAAFEELANELEAEHSSESLLNELSGLGNALGGDEDDLLLTLGEDLPSQVNVQNDALLAEMCPASADDAPLTFDFEAPKGKRGPKGGKGKNKRDASDASEKPEKAAKKQKGEKAAKATHAADAGSNAASSHGLQQVNPFISANPNAMLPSAKSSAKFLPGAVATPAPAPTKASLGGRPSQGGSMGRTFQWQPIKFPVYK
jgi:hypothetical protein